MGHAADFSNALLKPDFVASKVVAHQFAAPGTQEVTCMFIGTTWAEVIHHSLERRKRCGAVGSDLSPMGFLLPWRKHLHRGFIRLDHVLAQHRFAQRIDQWLELHASLSKPLR